MVVEYMRKGGLLRGSSGGLELFPNWIRVAHQVEELDTIRKDPETWGLIAADSSRQPVVDAWLDGMPHDKLKRLVSSVVQGFGSSPTFGMVGALESVFAALGRRARPGGPQPAKADLQQLVERQLSLLRPEFDGATRLVPVTRREHDEFVANGWAISLAWTGDAEFDPGKFSPYLPGWTDNFSVAELDNHFLPSTSWPPNKTTNAARRVASLGEDFLRGEPDQPSRSIPRILVPGYLVVAVERDWEITAEHVRLLPGTWEEWLLSQRLRGSAQAGAVLSAMWAVTPEFLPAD